MFWAQMKVLLPSYFGYWIFLTAFFMGAWYTWTKYVKATAFSWKFPVLASTVLTIYSMASLQLGIYQTTALSQLQQKLIAEQKANDPVQLKADFLKIVENVVATPDKITPELKQKFFTDYAKLFPNGPQDKLLYEQSVGAFFDCHKVFWEDALASFKTKKVTKSEGRLACEKLGGAFFGREKLFTMETLKNDDNMIESLASHKRLPTSDGKTIEPTEAMLQAALDVQVKSVQGVKKLFE